MREESQSRLLLWSDDPASVDLLSFDAVAQTVADALLDEALDPVALGLAGSWGSGKTTVLGLIAQELVTRATAVEKVLVIQTDPWRYDPATGAKASLIAEVLDALESELTASETLGDKAKKLLARLRRRVDWTKAFKLAATSSLTLSLPSIDSLVDLVKPKEAEADDVRGLEAFREEFAQLIQSDDLEHIRAVVVLVDDLDRCLPETVVDCLETMRLFLAVPRMSFVIAADEERVADAIRSRFRTTGVPEENGEQAEDPAKLYLHKIVQTAIPLPALSHYDTQAYLLQLLVQPKATPKQLAALVNNCTDVRRAGGTVDDIAQVPALAFDDELAFASRLTPLLYEKLRGNPRRIKRFLNDLHVRQSVAARRGITLDPAVIAKLMTLEVLMPVEFGLLLDWFSKGVMRDQLDALETAAGQPAVAPEETAGPNEDGSASSRRRPAKPAAPDKSEFSQQMIRWAKLVPSLRGTDLSPYLTLAASFAGVPLIDESLPERLRDIAANLLSESRAEQTSVRDSDLDALGDGDVRDLLLHIGRTMRDQPGKQKTGVNAVLRLARRRIGAANSAAEALLMLPASEVAIATPLQFQASDPTEVRAVLIAWRGKATNLRVVAALDNALKQGTSS